ncbi:uncharacterized protein M6B38_265655 [Iris pallida]|uniref:Uncharacterized protein n=1 Tax=Iris pallida TaxID=29817 RepID=A0AAX6IB40_IRIPA|nr:uncharacterized protein M6B38_265655 [Iris pallida]
MAASVVQQPGGSTTGLGPSRREQSLLSIMESTPSRRTAERVSVTFSRWRWFGAGVCVSIDRTCYLLYCRTGGTRGITSAGPRVGSGLVNFSLSVEYECFAAPVGC